MLGVVALEELNNMGLNKRKIFIIASSALVVGGVGYFIYSKFRNKNEIARIHAALDGRENAYGTIEDFADVFNGLPYIKDMKAKNPNIILLIPDYVTVYRKALHQAISGAGTDESAIKNIFRKLRDKVQIAQVADSYQRNYSENLLDALKGDMDVDDEEMRELNDIMISKPAFRVSK